MISVKYTGPFEDASGYGEATRNYIRALHEAGANITTQKVSFTGKVNYNGKNLELARSLENRSVKYNVKIIHVTPDIYNKYYEKGKYNIGHLFWETDRLPETWVDACNNMEEIWTGTELNKEVIQKSGVKVPVMVFPQAVEHELQNYRPYRLPNFHHDTSMLFYSIFDWNERKNPKTLLMAYWKAFKGYTDVGRLLKVHAKAYSPEGNQHLLKSIRALKSELPWTDKPPVYVCTKLLDDDEKHRIHETGDVFVSAHRGEGWGLPQAEAIVHKKVIISTGFGGIHEYLNKKQYFPIQYKMEKINKVFSKYYEPGMFWATVDEDHLIETLRKVYDYYHTDNKFVLKARSSSAHKISRVLFSYDEVGSKMLERIGAIGD